MVSAPNFLLFANSEDRRRAELTVISTFWVWNFEILRAGFGVASSGQASFSGPDRVLLRMQMSSLREWPDLRGERERAVSTKTELKEGLMWFFLMRIEVLSGNRREIAILWVVCEKMGSVSARKHAQIISDCCLKWQQKFVWSYY
jgi:hypothetical protein